MSCGTALFYALSTAMIVPVNHSVVRTLTRSLNTTVTVALTLLVVTVFSAASVRPFVRAILLGISVAGYASIFFSGMWRTAGMAGAQRDVHRTFPSYVLVPQPPYRDDVHHYDDQAYQRILHQLPRDRRAACTATSAEHGLGPPRERCCPPPYAHDHARPISELSDVIAGR